MYCHIFLVNANDGDGEWSHGHLVIWSLGHLVTGHMVTCQVFLERGGEATEGLADEAAGLQVGR